MQGELGPPCRQGVAAASGPSLLLIIGDLNIEMTGPQRTASTTLRQRQPKAKHSSGGAGLKPKQSTNSYI
jgi:hypothetical protein